LVRRSRAIHLGAEPNFRPATKAHPAFVVRDLDVLRNRLSEGGAEVTDDDSIPAVHRFYASDPFGNRIEFIAEKDRGFAGGAPLADPLDLEPGDR